MSHVLLLVLQVPPALQPSAPRLPRAVFLVSFRYSPIPSLTPVPVPIPQPFGLPHLAPSSQATCHKLPVHSGAHCCPWLNLGCHQNTSIPQANPRAKPTPLRNPPVRSLDHLHSLQPQAHDDSHTCMYSLRICTFRCAIGL